MAGAAGSPSFFSGLACKHPPQAARVRGPRGVRGGAQSRMTGAQKRAARIEREGAILKGTLEDDFAELRLGSNEE